MRPWIILLGLILLVSCVEDDGGGNVNAPPPPPAPPAAPPPVVQFLSASEVPDAYFTCDLSNYENPYLPRRQADGTNSPDSITMDSVIAYNGGRGTALLWVRQGNQPFEEFGFTQSNNKIFSMISATADTLTLRQTLRQVPSDAQTLRIEIDLLGNQAKGYWSKHHVDIQGQMGPPLVSYGILKFENCFKI